MKKNVTNVAPKLHRGQATVKVACPVKGAPMAANVCHGKANEGAYRCCGCGGIGHGPAK